MYSLIIIPIFVGLFTQAIKLSIDGIPKNFTLRDILSDYGGIPSSHTAFVSSLATVVLLREGIDSAAFAISLVLWLIVVRDAVGFRREIGRDAELTNKVAQVVLGSKYNKLPERIGHSPVEVLAGLLIGSGLSIFLYIFWSIIYF